MDIEKESLKEMIKNAKEFCSLAFCIVCIFNGLVIRTIFIFERLFL